jgi:hypothetical protein
MTRLNKQFVVYFDHETHSRIKEFSDKNNISMNQLVREGVEQRMSKDNSYVNGYNTAIKKTMIVVKKNNATKMRFPSGKSFAELINEDIQMLLKHKNT